MNRVHKLFLLLLASTLILMTGCKREEGLEDNAGAKRYFDAKIHAMKKSYPDMKETNLGSYIISSQEGDGELVGDSEKTPYLIKMETIYDLDWNVLSTNYAEVAQKIGIYDRSHYYGQDILERTYNFHSAGADELYTSMRIGGKMTAVIPGWLNTSERHKTAEDYYKYASGTDTIMEIELLDRTTDINKYQVDSIERYMARNNIKVDSLLYGYYFIQNTPPKDTSSFEDGEDILINYTGRLLNGLVFDTNIRDTARHYGIFNSESTYDPATITWDDEEYSNIQMTVDGNSGAVIDGFARALSKMKTGEKATAIFIASHGYGSNSSGNSIPKFSPLRFDIEVIGVK